MEQQTPIPPPQIKDEAARRAKTRHLPILDLGRGGGGRGGLGFPFIFSKIIGLFIIDLSRQIFVRTALKFRIRRPA